jgi:hypothetical protein
MEAADERNTGIPQSPGQIIGAKNQITRAFDGTEKSKQLSFEDVKTAYAPYTREQISFFYSRERRRIIRAFRSKYGGSEKHAFKFYSGFASTFGTADLPYPETYPRRFWVVLWISTTTCFVKRTFIRNSITNHYE